MKHKIPLWFVVLTAAMMLSSSMLVWRLFYATADGPSFPVELSTIVLPSPRPLKPFSLVDQDGQPFTLDHLQGRWTFLFFGYTHCPDICPMAMGMLGDVFKRLQNGSPQDMVGTEGAFVTVDPARDTPAIVKQYATYFNPAFKGLTGTEGQIRTFTRQVGATYFMASDFKTADGKPPAPPSDKEANLISHTSAFFLIDPLGRLVAVFPEYNNTDMILEEYGKIRKFVRIREVYANPAYNR
ncbi:MAG: SCO family protein [Magnetococcus sp. DMHC-8]